MDNKKIRIGYFCPYIPVGFLEEHAIEMVSLHDCQLEKYPTNSLLQSNLCSLVLKGAEAVKSLKLDAIIITNCCNSMQRLFDYLYDCGYSVYMYEIPRDQSKDKEYLKEYNLKLMEQLCNDFGITFKKDYQPKISYQWKVPDFSEITSKKVVYVLGNILPDSIEEIMKSTVYNYSMLFQNCKLESRIVPNSAADNEKQIDEFLIPCTHIYDYKEWFQDVVKVNHNQIAAIIYTSSTNCDTTLFLYKAIKDIARKNNIPELHLEISYSHLGIGQTLTRIEAFLEEISSTQTNMLPANETVPENETKQGLFQQRLKFANVIQPQLEIEAIKELISYQINIFIDKIKETPEKIVWTNMAMPVEIFYAMDLIPVHIELVSGWLASLGLSREYILKAESSGVSSSVCSYHKAVLGLMLCDPSYRPRIICLSSNICDGGFGLAQYCKNEFGTNIYFINIPYFKDSSSTAFVKEQFVRMLQELEENMQIKLNPDKLIQACSLSNTARATWIEANKLRKDIPDYQGRLSLRNLFGATFLFGSEMGVKVVDELKKDLNRLKLLDTQKNKLLKSRKRIFWIHFSPLYNNSVMEYMEDKLGFQIVTDIVSYIYWNEYNLNKPIDSIVDRMLSHFYMGSIERRREIYLQIIKEFEVDGIIHYIHRGCRPIAGSSWLVRELAKKQHIPYLELSGDCIDPRGISYEQTLIRLEAFRESLEEA